MRDCHDLGICQDRPIRCIGCPMQRMRIVEKTAAQWGVPVPVLGVLHPAGGLDASEQASGSRDAGGDRQIPGCPWPGRDLGVRPPMPGETALGWAEVHHGLKEGLF